MSCCPPGSAGFLSSDGLHVGAKITHGSTDLYATGPATAACGVILVPDIWGWDSGRTRNIADALAANGWAVVVPKLLTPVFPGGDGTDGDGMSPSQQPGNDFPAFCAWMAQFPPEVLRPKMADAFAALHARGVAKVAMVGHCWGVWACAHVAADEELNQTLTCVCGPHPSIGLENMVFKRSVDDLVARITRPFLLMPCKGDSDIYRDCEAGTLYKSLRARCPTTETIDFPDMAHGFFPRGDCSDAAVAAAVARCGDAITRFIGKHFE